MRVFGDRTWSFHGNTFIRTLVDTCDLTYTFKFSKFKNGVPTYGKITPSGCFITVPNGWLLAFDMEYMGVGTVSERTADSPAEFTPDEQNGYKVWKRVSIVAGSEAESKRYMLVQVQDENGKNTPAFDQWMEYCGNDAQGDTPGQFHWAVKDKASYEDCTIFG